MREEKSRRKNAGIVIAIALLIASLIGFGAPQNVPEENQTITLPLPEITPTPENSTSVENVTEPDESIPVPVPTPEYITVPENTLVGETVPEGNESNQELIPDINASESTIVSPENVSYDTLPINLTKPKLHAKKAFFSLAEKPTFTFEYKLFNKSLIKNASAQTLEKFDQNASAQTFEKSLTKNASAETLEEFDQNASAETLNKSVIKNEPEAQESGIAAPKESRKAIKKWATENETIEAFVYDPSGKLTDIEPELEELSEGEIEITLPQKRAFRAGVYRLGVELVKDEQVFLVNQEFPWGLVSLNTKKSIYKPGETAEFIIVVLDKEGHSVCDANISMTVTNPDNGSTAYSTADGIILPGEECGLYTANYTAEVEGNHTVDLSASINGVEVSFETNFSVQREYEFEILREAQSKIDPTKQDRFDVTIDIANFIETGADFVTIKEFVPAAFEITTTDATTLLIEEDTRVITWHKKLVDGTTSVNYSYSVPDVWPYLYALGPLELEYTEETFVEARPWYVAVDPLTVINVQSYPTVGGNWTVLFTTTGRANLTIAAVDGTTWSAIDEATDLQFLEVKCGEAVLDYEWVDGSVFIENYECNETGYEVSKVLTSGKHTLEFRFGGDVKYAYNDAGGWANSSFDRCKNITIKNAGSSNLTNFPAYINLTKDDDMLSNYQDVRFYSNGCNCGGSVLDYEIENYTAANAHIWVRIPSLPATGTNISVYYKNNTAVGSGENVSGVWDSNFKGVWHMKENPAGTAPQMKDSTSNGNNGTTGGSMTVSQQVTGKVDGSLSFDGVNDFVNISRTSSIEPDSAVSLSAWFMWNSYTSSTYGKIICKKLTASPYTSYGFEQSVATNTIFACVGIGSTQYYSTPQTLSLGVWHHLAMTWASGGPVMMYIDGVNVANSSAATGSILYHATPLRMANSSIDELGSVTNINGSLDEVELSNVSRSSNWINQSYRMVANQSTYVNFGSEESQPGNQPPTTPTNITCNGGSCNITVDASVVLQASGSTDADNDTITYFIEASLLNSTTAENTTDVSKAGAAAGSWPDSSFDRCKNITISNVGSSTLTNFSAYVNLTKDDDMLSNYQDLRFYSEGCKCGGTLMDYEIENYTASNAHIWVRIPSLPTAGKTISVYYKNNTAVGSGQNPTGVWDSYYKGVWHMKEINVIDSTSNGNNGTQSGGVTLNYSGKIDGADLFDGSNDYINAGDPASGSLDFGTGAFTVSAWITTTATTTTGNGRDDIIAKGDPTVSGYALNSQNNKATFMVGNNLELSGTTNINDGVWHYLVGTRLAGGTVYIYVDGKSENTQSNSESVSTATNFTFGKHGTSSASYFPGTMDEVRVSNTARSADWINQSYRIVANQSTYVSFGAEESSSTEANTSYTTYNDVNSNYSSITNITVKVEVDSYDPAASVQRSTNDPDLYLELYNGSAWIEIGAFHLNDSYTGDTKNTTNANFSLTTTDSSILTAWQNSTNQDLRIMGIYMDWYNATTIDEINYTNVWITITGKEWTEIGNHSASANFTWDTSGIAEQTCVDLRARAIDLAGSNTYSAYYTKGCCLNISHPAVNNTPTTPTNITCNGGSCDITVNASVVLQASGSTDPEEDAITYFIEAALENTTTVQNTTDVSLTVEGGISQAYIVNSAFADSPAGTTGNISKPTGTQEGDLMIFQIVQDGTGSSFTSPSPNTWTVLWAEDQTSAQTTASWYRIATSADDSVTEYSTTWSGSEDFVGGIVTIRNADTSNPFDVNATATSSSDTNVNPPSVTTTADNEIVLTFFGADGGDAGDDFDPPSGYTRLWGRAGPSGFGQATGGAANFTKVSYGVEDPGIWDSTISDTWWAGTIAIKNVAGATDTNTTATTYNNVDSNYSSITNVTVTVEVDSYDPSASVQQSTNDPDLYLELYNAAAWIEIGAFHLNDSYTGDTKNETNANFSLTTTDSSILTAWQTSTNQDMRIKGIYMDWYNATTIDEINYTNVWITINGKEWTEIGNHSASSTFTWNTADLPEQTCVDLRARAIDLAGSNTYSAYYTKGCCLNISHPAGYSTTLQIRNQTAMQNVTAVNVSGISGFTMTDPYNEVDSGPQNKSEKTPVVTIYNPSTSTTYRIWLNVEAGTGWDSVISDERFKVTADATDPGEVSTWTSVKPWGTDKDSGVTVTYGEFKDLYLAYELKGSGTGNATISVLGEVV